MPITFGAVGDIISVSLIVKDLLLALDKSRGSSAEYEGIVRELLVLDTALLRVDQLSRTRDATPQLHALYETARQTVQKCRESVDKFKDRNKKFDVFLAGGGSGNWGRDTARKIQWKASGRDEEVVKFRAEISGYTNSIHLLLATANITALDISDHKHSEAKLKIEQASDKQSQTLIEVQSKLEENRQLIITNAVTGESILERVKWIRNLGADLKSLVQSVILGNSTIYKEVMALHQAFRSRVDYSLSEEFFILEDPIGRIAPIHLRFITSWEALDAVMKVRFEGHPEGMDKIRRKQYLIHQDATGFKVDTRRKLEQAILPGQKVTMSVTFHEMERPQHQNLAHCPNCSKVTEASNDVSIVCANCNLSFRRIQEDDINQAGTQEPPESTSFGPRRSLKRPHAEWEVEHEAVDSTKVQFQRFKRICILTRLRGIAQVQKQETHILSEDSGPPQRRMQEEQARSHSGASRKNSYFVPGFGISRSIIQSEIRYFCGPDATVRPYTHQDRDGYLVTTPGPPLTKDQVDDLKDASREFEERQAERTQVKGHDECFVNKPVPVGHRVNLSSKTGRMRPTDTGHPLEERNLNGIFEHYEIGKEVMLSGTTFQ